MSDESSDPYADNPDLEWANTVAIEAVPRPDELGDATVPTSQGDLQNALNADLEDATVAAQADELEKAIQQDLQLAKARQKNSGQKNSGQAEPRTEQSTSSSSVEVSHSMQAQIPATQNQASTAPDHRFDTGMRAAQGMGGAAGFPQGGSGSPVAGSPGDSPATHGTSPQSSPPQGPNLAAQQRGPGSHQPGQRPQQPPQGPQQPGQGPQQPPRGPQQPGGYASQQPGMAAGGYAQQNEGPSWKQVASGLNIYRVAFVLLILLMPAIGAGLVLALKEESTSMLTATFYGGPGMYFLIGIGVVISQFKMSKVPARAGGSGVLTTAFVCSSIALAAMAIAYLWFMSLVDIERLGRMSLEEFGFTIIMIAILAGGAYLMWTIGFLLMVVGWRQVGESLNAGQARSLAGTTLILFGILFVLNMAQPFIVDAGGEPALMATGVASLVLTLVFLIWVLRAASSLKSAITSRFPGA